MTWDLTIKPDDWVLALWWTEFPAGQFDLLPRGGHRIALVRLLVPGSARQAPTWVTEDCTRPCGEEEWRRSQSFSTGGLLALLDPEPGRTGGRTLFLRGLPAPRGSHAGPECHLRPGSEPEPEHRHHEETTA